MNAQRDAQRMTLPNPLGGERRTFEWHGHQVAYVERGSGTGAPVVLVHSIHAAAWNMEWRQVVPDLARAHRVFAIDLLGFGASDRPDMPYTATRYLELLHDFLRDVVGEPAIVVGSSLGGTYAIALAASHPALVRAVCAIGPAGVTRLTGPGGAGSRGFMRFLRSSTGSVFFNAMVTRPSIRIFLRSVYANRRAMTDETVELFWAGAHHPNARFAPAAFIGMQLNHDIRPALPALTVPLLLLWGREAGQTPIVEAGPVRMLRPDAPFVALPGGDLPHDEQPAAFLTALTPFLRDVA